MEMEEAKEKAKDVMDKVVVSSKDAFSKAGNAIQKFGDKSVLKIEIMQLKSKRKNAVSKLGVYAEKKFTLKMQNPFLVLKMKFLNF